MAPEFRDDHAPADPLARAEHEAERLLRKQDGRRRAVARVFEDGELLAGRYRVLELLERGGSGQVYRALDEELDHPIALKTLHPGAAAATAALERFKQEVLLARSVTHENVCRLFELVRHGADHGGAPLFFLTMELIEGETLAQLAEREGPLPLEQLIDLGSQLARGLRAAHRKGVVHRDLKSQNVLLEPLGEGRYRAALTDFGLATVSHTPHATHEPDEPGGPLVGTPLTMAPEQVRGEPVTVATDLYALGVVLYHLGTGAWPFSGTTPLDTAIQRLEEAPVSPRDRRPEIPADLEALILQCLEQDPAKRPRSADEILSRLQAAGEDPGPAPGAGLHAAPPRGKSFVSSMRWAALLVTLAALALIAIAASLLHSARSAKGTITSSSIHTAPRDIAAQVSQAASLSRRASLLWLGLEGPEKAPPEADSEWLGTLVEKGLFASLAATGDLRLVAGEPAERIAREWSAEDRSFALDESAADELRRRAGVDSVLLGRVLTATEGRLRFELELAGSDAGLTRLEGLVTTEDLPGLGHEVSELGDAIREALELDQPTIQEAAAAKAEIPSDPEAAKLYAQGLAALRGFDSRRAAERLQMSLAIEPDHPKVLRTLASVWMRMGHSQRSKSTARLAFENAGGLSRAEQMSIEAFHRLRERDWARAQEIFTALWEFFPDESRYGLGLLEAQDRSGDLDGALATLAQLREREPRAEASPKQARFDLAESMVAYHQGDYERSQQAARRAQRIGESLGAPALIAEALIQESLTRIVTDSELAPVEANLTRAIELLEMLGEPRSVIRAQLYLADCARRGDRFADADAAYRKAIEIATSIGNGADLDRARTSLAINLDRRGLLKEGLVLKEQVLQSYRERNVDQGAAIAQENIAITLLKMGRPADALGELAQVQTRYEELGDRIGVAWSPYYQGRAWLDRGELLLAERHLEKARQASEQKEVAGAGDLAAAVAYERARLAWTRGELDKARQLMEPVIPYYEGQERPFDIAEAQLLLARIRRRQSQWQDAENYARSAFEHFEKTAITHQEVAAKAELAEIEMARFRATGFSEPTDDLQSPTAGPACQGLGPLPDLEHRRFALLAQVTSLACRRLGGSSIPALLPELDGLIAESAELELFWPELRARLLRARWLKEIGDEARASLELDDLRREARERGFADPGVGEPGADLPDSAELGRG